METTAAVRNTSRRRASQLQVTVSSSCRSSKSGVLDYLIYRFSLRRPSKPTEDKQHNGVWIDEKREFLDKLISR